jgi:pimeloyl-ACP methyl ester carboxylesterase
MLSENLSVVCWHDCAMKPTDQFVDTSLLRVAYEEWNPQGKSSIILVHGWPDSPRTWNSVAPRLADAGYRVIVPALRGYSPTTFLRADTPRTGQLASLGRDLIEFIQALGLIRPALVGHDWGARAVANACGLAPGIASHLVMLSVGYGTNVPDQVLSLEQAQRYWYHWLMATPRGEEIIRNDRRNFSRMMWDLWAPSGWYDPAEFERTADAFENDDWADIVLHSYQHRWGHAAGDPAYAEDERALNPAPVLSVPTLMLHGEVDGVTLLASSANKEAFFAGPYARHLLPGVGHFPQREAPERVAEEILAFLRTH